MLRPMLGARDNRTRLEVFGMRRRVWNDWRGRGRTDDPRRLGLAVVVPALTGETGCCQQIAVDAVHEASLVVRGRPGHRTTHGALDGGARHDHDLLAAREGDALLTGDNAFVLKAV